MLAWFALRLIAGMGLMWMLMPRRAVTSGFFRIQMLLTLSLAVLAALTIGDALSPSESQGGLLTPAIGTAACAALAGFSFLGSVMWTLERRAAGTAFAALVAAAAPAVLLAGTWPSPESGAPTMVLVPASELASATLLGAAVTGMLLGHWYLTAPAMSIDPLRRLTQFLLVAALARLAAAAAGTVIVWDRLAADVHWLWLVLRWLAGIAGPLLAAVMVIRILRYRNTQSATGVLFACVILVFLGELTATILHRETGVPV